MDILKPILDLIKELIQPQQGTKFLLTIAALAAIYFLHEKGLSTNTTDIVIGLMVAVYYVADVFHKVKKQENGK